MSPSADIPTIISATVPEGARREGLGGNEGEEGSARSDPRAGITGLKGGLATRWKEGGYGKGEKKNGEKGERATVPGGRLTTWSRHNGNI